MKGKDYLNAADSLMDVMDTISEVKRVMTLAKLNKLRGAGEELIPPSIERCQKCGRNPWGGYHDKDCPDYDENLLDT